MTECKQIYVNGRFRAHKITGVQRYAHEITQRISKQSVVCQPGQQIKGWRGHLWEQSILPMQTRQGVLWSPCAAGPLTASSHVVTYHDLFPIDHPEWYSKTYATWYQVMMRGLARRARALIAVSHYTKQRLVEQFQVSPEKITVIHNGISHAFFRDPAVRLPPAQIEGMPSRQYLLTVGSLEPRKNLNRLLKAWSNVSSELPSDLWLVVAGSGDKRVFKGAVSDELPERVFFTGYVPDAQLVPLYAGSIGFVYPSLGEGFGLPPLEAMACGVPVLTSAVTSLPEVCSSAALYADPTDTSDIAQKMKLLATDQALRTRLSYLGWEWAKRFTWDRSAEQTLRILEDVACSGGYKQ